MTTREKQLWIVNHHALVPSRDGGSGRHLHLGIHLRDRDWRTTLIVAGTDHPAGSQHMPGPRLTRRTEELGIETLWIKTNSYGRSLLLRLLAMVLFALNLLRPGATKGLPRPNVVIGSTVHPLAAWAGWRLSRRHKVPFVYEIRDVWPETLQDVSGLHPKHPVFVFFRFVDSILIKHADLIVSPLPMADLHLAEMGFKDRKFLWISNGEQLPESWEEPVDRDGEPFCFMYLGSHGRANALDFVILAFDKAVTAAPHLDLKLRLIGSGQEKQALRAMAADLASANRISFEGPVPKSMVIELARESDCLVVHVANRPVYRFGISPNKFFTYLGSGRPIIAASSAPADPVKDSKAGISVPGEDVDELAAA